jgi:hypothetical protein
MMVGKNSIAAVVMGAKYLDMTLVAKYSDATVAKYTDGGKIFGHVGGEILGCNMAMEVKYLDMMVAKRDGGKIFGWRQNIWM